MDEVSARVGDAERRTVDARLQQAVGDGRLTLHEYDERAGQVWAARTRAELDATVQDLPGPVPAPSTAPAARTGRRPGTRRAVAVMSGDRLAGPVAAGQHLEAYAVMGGAVVDLRRDDLPAQVQVRAVAVMGGIEVLVPRGVTVQLSGVAFMGGRDVQVDPAMPGAPVVDVQAYALMGGVEVKHGDQGAVSLTKAGSPQAWAGRAHDSPVPTRGRHGHPLRNRIVVAVVVVAAAFGLTGVVGADDAAVFGSRTVQVHAGDDVDVANLFGSVKVVVDDGVPVTSSGTVVFGSDDCRACTDGTTVTGTSAHVRGRGAFGSIEIVHRADQGD